MTFKLIKLRKANIRFYLHESQINAPNTGGEKGFGSGL
jgi:hypothetical protein